MRQQPSKLGFSLIELSVVILVIGILVIGITQGSRIIKEAKLKSAIALTNSSPVVSTTGLISWWETATKASYSNSTYPVNGSVITSWLDTNPHTIEKNPLTGSGTTFVASAINGLPAINLNGTSNYLESTKSINSNDFTYIVVLKFGNNTGSTIRRMITSHNFNNGAVHYNRYGDIKKLEIAISGQTHNGGDNFPDSTNELTMNKSYIMAVSSNGSTTTHYTNGVVNGSATVSSYLTPKTLFPLTIGAWNNSGTRQQFFEAQMSEVIIFGCSLSNMERQSIEQYLSQKYAIKLS
jgi:prepilin-type N-terminal cleavage/methylation domain-containing protein